jgi:hypothetical protein
MAIIDSSKYKEIGVKGFSLLLISYRILPKIARAMAKFDDRDWIDAQKKRRIFVHLERQRKNEFQMSCH